MVEQPYAHVNVELQAAVSQRLSAKMPKAPLLVFGAPPPAVLEPHPRDGVAAYAPTSADEHSSLPLIWVGSDESPALLLLLLSRQTPAFAHFDPRSGVFSARAQEGEQAASRLLRRRYALVSRAAEAHVFGLVVGTLGVAGFTRQIAELRSAILASGKRCHTFLVGRPTPAKLANFPECGCFVMVACPWTTLVDGREYLAPLVTPFEAMLALSGADWPTNGGYTTGFTVAPPAPALHDSQRPMDDLEAGGATQLALRPGMQVAGRAVNGELVDSAAEFLAQRVHYRGMLPTAGDREEAPTTIIEGSSGRAAAYSHEVSTKTFDTAPTR